jgi:signal transduction histidine kinase
MNEPERNLWQKHFLATFMPKTFQGKLIVALSTVFVYIVFFLLLYRQIGNILIVVFAIPVLFIAWLFGLRGGLLAGLLTVPLHIALVKLVGGSTPSSIAIASIELIIGSIVFVFVGAFAGFLRDMNEWLKQQLVVHRETETAVQFHARDIVRTNHLITVLSQIAANFDTSTDPDSIFETMGSRLKSLDIHSFVGLLDTADPAFIIRYLSANPVVLRNIERLLNLSVRGFRLTPERFPLFDQIVEQKQAIYAENIISLATIALHDLVPHSLKHLLQLTNIQANSHAIILPLMIKERVIGVLGLWSPELREFDKPAIMIFANQVAVAFENARLFDSERRIAGRLEALSQASARLSANLELQPILETILEHTLNQLPARDTDLFLYDGLHLSFGASLSASTGFRKGPYAEPRADGLTYTVARSGEHVVIANAGQDPLYRNRPWGGSIISFPLRLGDRVWGVMNIAFEQEYPFPEEDLRILQLLADQAASAIQNARLLEQEQQHAQQLERQVAARTAELAQQYRRQAALAALESAVSDRDELRTLLSQIVAIIIEHLAPAGVGFALWDEATNDVSASVAKSPEEILPAEEWGKTAAQWIVKRQRPLILSDEYHHSSNIGAMLKASRIHSFVGIPLVAREKVMGALYVFDDQHSRSFTPEDISFLSVLAHRVALAILKAELYETQQVTNAALARANRLKDEFLASMSHELRTPLNAILGLSEALQEGIYGDLSERQNYTLKHIESSGRHLLALINDILDISKIEAGQVQLEMELVWVESLCQASLQFVRQSAHKKQILVNFSVDPTLTTIQADGRRLKQILINLLSNAVKFTPEKGVIGLEVMGDTDNQMVHFTVWDTGIGIAPEDIDRLFQPFVQLDARLARHYTGTGLGLALVQRMVSMHEGHIQVESEVGKGSHFTVSLPWTGQSMAVSFQAPMSDSPAD